MVELCLGLSGNLASERATAAAVPPLSRTLKKSRRSARVGASQIFAPCVGDRSLTARSVLRSQVCHRPGLLRAAAEVVMTRTDPAAMAEAMRLLAAAVACPRDTLSGGGVEGGRASPCEGQEGAGSDVVGVVLDDVLLNQAGALRPAPRGVVDRSAETGQQN
jgi:hypothetical protein